MFVTSQTWPKYYGESDKYDASEDIIETYDKGYIMGGEIADYSTGSIMNGWIIKTNVNGEILWEKILDNDIHISLIRAIEQSNDGGVLICGSVRRTITKSEPFVIKLDACGEKEWCTIFAGSNQTNPWAQDIKETPSGDIIVLINQYGQDNVEDMHLAKLNAMGELLWMEEYCNGEIHPESAVPMGNKIMITTQNDYLIVGEVYWEDPWNPGGLKPLRPLFVMVDELGIENWVLPFGLNDTIHGTGDNILEINDGFFIGTGSYWTNQEFVEPLFMKINYEGAEIDYQILYTNQITQELIGGSFLSSIQIDSILYSGGVFIFPDNLGYPIMEAKLNYDSLSFSFNSVLDRIYDENSEPYAFDKTNDQELLSNSTFKESGNWDISLSKLNLNLEYDTIDPSTYTYDSLCTTPGLPQSGFIYLDNCNLIVDVPSPQQYHAFINTIPIKVYPNPVNEGIVTFEFENTDHHSNILLKCFDIYGKQAYIEKVYRYQEKSELNISNWQKGMYVVVVYSNGLPVGQCKFVVQ